MGIINKKTKKDEIEVAAPETNTAGKCACGQPIATDLGQTSVCKSHIRTS